MTPQRLREEIIAKGKELGLHLGYKNKLEEFVDWVLSPQEGKCCRKCEAFDSKGEDDWVYCDDSKCKCHKPVEERNWGDKFDEIWATSDLVTLKENLKNFTYKEISDGVVVNLETHTSSLVQKIEKLKEEDRNSQWKWIIDQVLQAIKEQK